MPETELAYLCKAFMGFSDRKKDYVLNTAKSLLEIQKKNTDSVFPKKSIPNSKEKKFL